MTTPNILHSQHVFSESVCQGYTGVLVNYTYLFAKSFHT